MFMRYQSFHVSLLLNMGQKQRYSNENYRIIPHVVAPRNSKKRKHNLFKCGIPIFKFRQKAESVEVLGKGQTTNIFTIYFFYYYSKTQWQSLVILTFCLHSLPLACFRVKSFLICYEDPLFFMMNNLDNNRGKLNCFLYFFK